MTKMHQCYSKHHKVSFKAVGSICQYHPQPARENAVFILKMGREDSNSDHLMF